MSHIHSINNLGVINIPRILLRFKFSHARWKVNEKNKKLSDLEGREEPAGDLKKMAKRGHRRAERESEINNIRRRKRRDGESRDGGGRRIKIKGSS